MMWNLFGFLVALIDTSKVELCLESTKADRLPNTIQRGPFRQKDCMIAINIAATKAPLRILTEVFGQRGLWIPNGIGF